MLGATLGRAIGGETYVHLVSGGRYNTSWSGAHLALHSSYYCQQLLQLFYSFQAIKLFGSLRAS